MKEWNQFLAALEQELDPAVVNRWLRSLKVVRFDAGNLYLQTEDPMQVSWFEEHIRPRIKQGFMNENFRPIKVHLLSPTSQKKDAPPPAPLFKPDSLDPECTHANFITGSGNLLACKLVQESPFNPIFLYGVKGSGKTHLMMAAAHECKKKAFYVHASTFTDHVVNAIRMGHMAEFRYVYRNIDLLLIDDIDLLSGRAATQEEFFHTFNFLHTLGKQIVLSSSVAPSKLKEIESRLISRFEWGIAIKIEPVEIKEILHLKAKLWNLTLSESLEKFLLEKFPIDPVLALQALALRMHGTSTPTVAAAEKILSDLLRKETEKAITPEWIVKALSAHFGIAPEDVLGKSQMREYALPRQIAMYLCRERLKMPFQAVGKIFERDHSTVMSSVKQIQKAIDEKNQEILDALSLHV